MKPLLLAVSLLLTINFAFAQYYLRGELKDEKGNGLQGARISLFSKGTYPYYTGSSGAFGIPSNLKIDTITFSLEGYDTLKTAVNTTKYGNFILKMTNQRSISNTLHLNSVTKNLHIDNFEANNEDGESYSSTIENSFLNTKNFPETGFALHVDRASYSNIRRFLNQKTKPPPDAVRIEELLNYFNFCAESKPDQKKAFFVNTTLTSCPWNLKNRLLFINIQAKKIDLDTTPPANLVFLIDVSGSMDIANRSVLIKNAFKLLTRNLRPKDIVSIVTYGDQVTVLLQPTTGDNKQTIIEAIEGLRPNGYTPGASAIRAAYRLARNTFIANGNNRVILATDGDFNVGQTSEKDLEELVTQERKTGIYLTCLGVGMGNYKDSKLEALAKKGNGNFAYLDNEAEAEKVLVEEFAQTLYTVANKVYLDVKFDPAIVKEYRLIGFDNKKSALADKTTELEGGEVGSGHCLLAAFEIVLTDQTDMIPVKYKQKPVATIQLSYKNVGNNDSIKEQYEAQQNYVSLDKANPDLRFAAAVIIFGTLLKQSDFSNNFSWGNLYDQAISSVDKTNLLQAEFLNLINKAKKLYSSGKRRK